MYTGTVETLFEFQSSAYDMDGTVANLAWDFGDSETSTETDPDHQYDKHGTYTVTLIAEDDDGAKSAEISKIITVLNSKPIAKISAMPQTVFVGDELEFDGSGSSDADGESLTYTWDLGDGSSGTGKTTKHVYPEKGTYLVTLTVTDESGNEASASVEIVIKDKSTIEGQTTKSELTSGLAIAAVIAIILIMIVLFAVSMRKRKTAEGESDLEEE